MSSKIYIIEDFINFINEIYGFFNEIALPPFRYIRNPKISAYQYHRKINKFQKAGLIVPKKKGIKIYYKFTTKAKIIKNKYLKKQKRTDGLSSLITFDVPAKYDKERTIFRRFLLRNGFTLLQKSLLISPDKVNSLIFDFAKELKIDRFIIVASVKIEHNW